MVQSIPSQTLCPIDSIWKLHIMGARSIPSNPIGSNRFIYLSISCYRYHTRCSNVQFDSLWVDAIIPIHVSSPFTIQNGVVALHRHDCSSYQFHPIDSSARCALPIFSSLKMLCKDALAQYSDRPIRSINVSMGAIAPHLSLSNWSQSIRPIDSILLILSDQSIRTTSMSYS